VVTGIHARPLSLDLTPLVRNQQQLRGSFRPPESDWPQALDLMGEMDAVLSPMVSHVLPLVEGRRGLCAGARQAGEQGTAEAGGLRCVTLPRALLALWNDVAPEMDRSTTTGTPTSMCPSASPYPACAGAGATPRSTARPARAT
jgi:hypothetical protein